MNGDDAPKRPTPTNARNRGRTAAEARWLSGEKLADDEGNIINAADKPFWVGCMDYRHPNVPFMFKVPNDHKGDIVCPGCGRTQQKPEH